MAQMASCATDGNLYHRLVSFWINNVLIKCLYAPIFLMEADRPYLSMLRTIDAGLIL